MGQCPTNGASGVNSTVGQGLPVWVKWARHFGEVTQSGH